MSLEDIHTRHIDVENRVIYLYGDGMVKDDEPGVDYRMANTFIKNLDFLARTEGDINIAMGTIGGDWNYGMAIYDAIKACKRKTIITAYAWARSMSSIILQAATERVLMPNCDFMVHYGTYACEGYYLSAKSGLKFTERSEEMMLRIYAERCVNSLVFSKNRMGVKEVIQYIDKQMKENGDWWLSASSAVNFGFVDRVGGYQELFEESLKHFPSPRS